MGRRGTVRHDIKRSCPVAGCPRDLRPCNVERHVKAAHPEAVEILRRFERERIDELLRAI